PGAPETSGGRGISARLATSTRSAASQPTYSTSGVPERAISANARSESASSASGSVFIDGLLMRPAWQGAACLEELSRTAERPPRGAAVEGVRRTRGGRLRDGPPPSEGRAVQRLHAGSVAPAPDTPRQSSLRQS